MKVKLKSGYIIQEIAGEKILIAGHADSVNCSRMLVLNDSASELVQSLIESALTVDELAELLTETYNVKPDQARQDVEELLKKLSEQDVLEQVD